MATNRTEQGKTRGTTPGAQQPWGPPASSSPRSDQPSQSQPVSREEAVPSRQDDDWTATGPSDRRAAGSTGLGGEVRQMVHEKTQAQFGNQKQRATDTLGSLAGAVRSVTDQLREGGQGDIANYANRAADALDRWSTKLGEQDLDDAVRQVRQFARQRPALFLGAAFGVGVLAVRFLKSSADDKYGAPASRRNEPLWQSESDLRMRVGDSPSVAHEMPRVDPDVATGRGGL